MEVSNAQVHRLRDFWLIASWSTEDVHVLKDLLAES
jgi:hypothetical protein